MRGRLGSVDSVVLPVPVLVVVLCDDVLCGGTTCQGHRVHQQRTREAKEERHIAMLSDVAATMQREHAALGHEVVHDCKDALFHFPSILRAEDDHLHAAEADVHAAAARHVRGVAVAGEGAGIEDGKVGLAKVVELLFSGSYQHVVHEQRVVGLRGGALR